MKIIVTAGPTYEPLDEVRRLTNFSTGRLGSELAAYLAQHGHKVTLLLGEPATFRAADPATEVEPFTTAGDLRERLQALSGSGVEAVFHAAAVGDFTFSRVWRRSPTGELIAIDRRKIPTRHGTLLAELTPTPKIIARLREFFPQARLVGWKYEVVGDPAETVRLAQQQLAECRTDGCVVNGPAYGPGFGLVNLRGECRHLSERTALFAALGEFVADRQPR